LGRVDLDDLVRPVQILDCYSRLLVVHHWEPLNLLAFPPTHRREVTLGDLVRLEKVGLHAGGWDFGNGLVGAWQLIFLGFAVVQVHFALEHIVVSHQSHNTEHYKSCSNTNPDSHPYLLLACQPAPARSVFRLGLLLWLVDADAAWRDVVADRLVNVGLLVDVGGALEFVDLGCFLG